MPQSIDQWLAHIESENTSPILTRGEYTTKRKRAADSTATQPPLRKRRALLDITMTPASERSTRKSQRVKGKATSNAITTPQRHQHGVSAANIIPSNDGEETPRPNTDANAFSNAPSLSPTRSSTRSRSSSPRKISHLASLPNPIIYHELSPYDDVPAAPAAVQRMVEQVRVFARSERILPLSMQGSLQAADMASEFKLAHIFDASSRRAELGTTPPLDRVDEICFDTRACSARWVHEAAWNCESQHAIGKLAWRHSSFMKMVRWENITVAEIHPRPLLLPPNIASRPPSATRVDFGIVLESSVNLRRALPYLEPLDSHSGTPSWNPTTLSSIVHNPLVSVVETKRKGADTQNAEYQIGIWAFALFKRLRLLVENSNRDESAAEMVIPVLPLLAVDGEEWVFHVASQDREGATTIWKYGAIGRANTRLGVYQIVAVLQLVFEWAELEFRPWFERCCLPVLRG